MTHIREREPIRVLMERLPELMRSVLCDVLGDRPGIEIVADGSSTDEMTDAAIRVNPDVIVIGISDEALLKTFSRFRTPDHAPVVGLGLDGRQVVVYHENLSPWGLRDVILTSAGVRAEQHNDAGEYNRNSAR